GLSNLDLIKPHVWNLALSGVKCVIHCAARVHIMHDKSNKSLTEFRKMNLHATIDLAKQAIANKVKRFIYLSSIKVNGENSLIGKPFTADDPVNPSDPYAISKMEAEQALMSLAKETSMEIVIIRPPLIYGPGVKANFKTMINWIKRLIPLPLNNIKNKRSLVAIDNLIDFIKLCIVHPKAANQIFLVADGEDVSTTELLIKIANTLNKPIFWLPIPLWIIRLFAKILTKNKLNNKLFDNLQIDLNKNKKLLGWEPLINMDFALKATVNSLKK
ncbi:MAG: NAD-dependent epimerase/dehydratase family protein, partial [Gammaproteobacteria bacterium]